MKKFIGKLSIIVITMLCVLSCCSTDDEWSQFDYDLTVSKDLMEFVTVTVKESSGNTYVIKAEDLTQTGKIDSTILLGRNFSKYYDSYNVKDELRIEYSEKPNVNIEKKRKYIFKHELSLKTSSKDKDNRNNYTQVLISINGKDPSASYLTDSLEIRKYIKDLCNTPDVKGGYVNENGEF